MTGGLCQNCYALPQQANHQYDWRCIEGAAVEMTGELLQGRWRGTVTGTRQRGGAVHASSKRGTMASYA